MIHFIVNPQSRSGKGYIIWKSVEEKLNRLHVEHRSYMTQYTGHARKIAGELTQEPSDVTIAVIGGDGTINEVLSGLKLCPHARSGDGILDVCVVSDVSRFKVALLLPTAFFGMHTHIRGVHILRCKKISIQSGTPLPVHRDGESAGTRTEIAVGMEDRRVRVICPGKSEYA